MTDHILTKDYSVLRGFSTNSKFARPANVADKAVNMMRLPGGAFSPRRGYHIQSDTYGGLGNGVYESDGVSKPVCISRDGNLYIEQEGTLTIAFSDPNGNADSFISYEIYVDPENVSDTQECDFDPYLVVDDNALATDCIDFKLDMLTAFSGVAVGSGTDTYTGTLTGSPLTPGSVFFTDGTLYLQDNGKGRLEGDIGTGPNTINYTTGAYEASFSANTGAVTAEYKTTLQNQFTACQGKGFGEAFNFSVENLADLLNAVSGVTATIDGNPYIPSAFIDLTEATIIPHGQSAVLTYVYWESANRTVPKTFSGLAAKISDPDFRIATMAAYEQAIYIATRYDEIQKYDGQTVYRAGMPQGSPPTLNAVNTGAGTVADGVHLYYTTYEQIDHNGRLVEGRISLSKTITTAGSQNVEVTVTNLTQGSGWNTGCAIVNGPQVGVNTITVDDPHSLQTGDWAYFFDGVTSDYVTRTVTATTATSITIDGNAVDVADNAVISNNLKINIFSTPAGGTARFLVASIPNNSYAATQVYTDTLSDALLQLNRQFVSPAREPDPPPKVGIVFPYNNQIIYTEDLENEDYVWYSEPAEPEYVPRRTSPLEFENSFIVPSNNDDITGCGLSGSSLIITKLNSIYSVSGDLATDQFSVQPIGAGSNIGCVSHHTIKEVGSLLYLLHTTGVYSIAENQFFPTDVFGDPVPLSQPINTFFREENFFTNKRYVLKRATAVNYTKDKQYILFLPSEENTGPRGANDNSRVLVYDYEGKDWFEWTRVNGAGGFYVLNDNLYWQDRVNKNETIDSKTYVQNRKYRLIDQVDHVTPIRATWESSWEDLGQPQVRKKFVRTVLLFDEISSLYQQNIPTLCFSAYKDWVDGRVVTRTDVMQKINSSKWSSGQLWNYLSWSGYQDSFIRIPLQGSRGVAKSLKIGIQMNKLNTTFRLQGFQNEISPDYRRVITR